MTPEEKANLQKHTQLYRVVALLSATVGAILLWARPLDSLWNLIVIASALCGAFMFGLLSFPKAAIWFMEIGHKELEKEYHDHLGRRLP